MTARRTLVCSGIGERYVGPHELQPDPEDEALCLCGLERDSAVHE